MTARALLTSGMIVSVAVAFAACRPKVTPVTPVPPVPPRSDLIVLLPDPDDGHVGAATVTAQGNRVDLTIPNQGTRVVSGQPPSAPATIGAGEIQRLFGDALAARPLPVRQFLLYFRTGDETLTPESQALVPDIVEFVRGRPAPDVTVIGHTDTTGGADANADLGLRRGNLVRDLLVQGGLDPTQVDVASHGEADLLVPTPDDTAEARNRRVEVTVR